jgi:hypothetical protein
MKEDKTEINIDEMTVIELKALAFDLIAELEVLQNNLKVVNQKINEKK